MAAAAGRRWPVLAARGGLLLLLLLAVVVGVMGAAPVSAKQRALEQHVGHLPGRHAQTARECIVAGWANDSTHRVRPRQPCIARLGARRAAAFGCVCVVRVICRISVKSKEKSNKAFFSFLPRRTVGTLQ